MTVFADVRTALLTHAIAAGGAMANPIVDCVSGPPTPGPAGRSIRLTAAGQGDPIHFEPGTLNSTLVAKRFRIRGFWPVSEYGTDHWSVMEAEMDAFEVQILTRLWGDYTLGGACAALQVEPATVEYLDFPATFGVVEFYIDVEFDEYTVAP